MIRATAPTREEEKSLQYNFELFERGVTDAVGVIEEQVKQDWRSEVRRAGLGGRLANTIRGATYPTAAVSANAKALIWTKAPAIISAHEEGAVIRASRTRYLAIPTAAAGRGAGGNRITPADWSRRRGVQLRPVPGKSGTILLIAVGARVDSRGRAQSRGPRSRSAAQDVVVFVLVPQVKLRKRLDLMATARAAAAALPALMAIYTREGP